MGAFGAFNLTFDDFDDFDVDEMLRLQEEEERRQQEAALAGIEFADLAADYPDIFSGPGPGAQPVVDSSTIGGAADLSGIDWEGLAAEWQAAQTDPVADEINLMGDLMGDPSLGYSMDPSGYRVDADGYIVSPEGDVTNYTPWQVSQQATIQSSPGQLQRHAWWRSSPSTLTFPASRKIASSVHWLLLVL